MFRNKEARLQPVAERAIGREPKPQDPRIWQVSYGRTSNVVLKVLPDRVKRTLLLHEPRSRDPNRTVRVRLPDGKLPGDEYSEEHRDGVIIQWAREDADNWLDGLPPQHALDCDDEGDGRAVSLAETIDASNYHHPARQGAVEGGAPAAPAASAAPAVTANQAASAAPAVTANQAAPAAPQQAPAPEPAKQPLRTENAPPKTKSKDAVSGVVMFEGQREHSSGGRAYQCYTVDVRTADGHIETRRGTDLEDRMHFAGASVGDSVQIRFYGKKGRKNLYYVTKL